MLQDELLQDLDTFVTTLRNLPPIAAKKGISRINKWFFERSVRDFPPPPCDGRDREEEEIEISFSSLAFKGNRRSFRHSKRKK